MIPLSSDGDGGVSDPVSDAISEAIDELIEWILSTIVNGVLTIINTVADALELVADDLLDIIELIGSILILPFRILADGALGLLAIVEQLVVELTLVLGPAAPLAIPIGVGIMMGIGAISARAVIEIVRFI